jgi:uncharacterized protein YheU (UPF0270 family)
VTGDDRRIVDDPFEDAPREPFEDAPRQPARPEPRPPADAPYEAIPEKPAEDAVIVPADALSADSLAALIEEFVTRHGTDLSDAGDKVAQVRLLLKTGKVQIVFDPNTESCNIVAVG